MVELTVSNDKIQITLLILGDVPCLALYLFLSNFSSGLIGSMGDQMKAAKKVAVMSNSFGSKESPTLRDVKTFSELKGNPWASLPTFFTICVSIQRTTFQGGITCGAIDEPWKFSKAIDKRVIIDFRDKNVVIARFRDQNEVFI